MRKTEIEVNRLLKMIDKFGYKTSYDYYEFYIIEIIKENVKHTSLQMKGKETISFLNGFITCLELDQQLDEKRNSDNRSLYDNALKMIDFHKNE